jgi:sporulation protein YqfC
VSVWRRLLEGFTGQLEMPQEVFLDLPQAVLIGNRSIQIGNHKGILEYSPRKIRVRTGQGEMIVTGTHMKIASIFQQEVVIGGRITSVQFAAKPRGGGL